MYLGECTTGFIAQGAGREANRERLSSPQSMLGYVILLNIHKGIGLQVRRCVLLYFDLDC